MKDLSFYDVFFYPLLTKPTKKKDAGNELEFADGQVQAKAL